VIEVTLAPDPLLLTRHRLPSSSLTLARRWTGFTDSALAVGL